MNLLSSSFSQQLMSLIGDTIHLYQILHPVPAVPRLVPGEVDLDVQQRKEKEKGRQDEDVAQLITLGDTIWASEYTECHLDLHRPKKWGLAKLKESIWD